MKKTSKRMIISVLTLVLTVVALGTTTFAWFSLSTTSKVSNLGGNITGGDGLEIRLALRTNDVEPYTYAYTPWQANIDVGTFFKDKGFVEFDAVTADASWAFTKMTQNAETGKVSLDGDAIKNKDYLEFEIQFRSQLGGTVVLSNITWGGPAVSFNPTGIHYQQYYGQTPNGLLEVEAFAKYGARISFAENVYQYGGDVVAVDADVIKGNHVMGSTGVMYGQWSFLTENKNMDIYAIYNAETRITNPATIIIRDAWKSDTEIITDPDNPNSYRTNCVLVQTDGVVYWEGSLPVRVWIEGWDADSYDSVFTSLLEINLTFKKDMPVG